MRSFAPFDVPGTSQDIQQVVEPQYTESAPQRVYSAPSSSGGGFGVRDGVSIATSILPLIALFSGKGKNKSKTAARQPAQIQHRAAPQREQTMDERTKLLLLGGSALAILGIGVFVMSKR